MSDFLIKFKVTFLVTGGIVGAGILALPVNTGMAGFIPAVAMITLAGASMLFSAFIVAGEAVEMQGAHFDLPTVYEKHLGSFGKWIAVAANLLILYGFLVAYLTGATSVIVNLLEIPVPSSVVMLVFFLLITAVTVKGVSVVSKYSSLLVILLFVSFALLVYMGGEHIETDRLRYADWTFAPEILPIIVASFYFHNVIPQAAGALVWNRRAIMTAITVGIVLGTLMNVAWVLVGIAALPLTGGEGSLLYAYQHNLPATVPMTTIIKSRVFMTNALVFSLLAISTSYLGFGSGILTFTTDFIRNHIKRKSRPLELAIAFGPPLLISLIYPNIFLVVLNLVGGLGVALLFGVLPSIIFIRKSRSRTRLILGLLLLLLFSIFVFLELGQELGFLRIDPKIEDWTHYAG